MAIEPNRENAPEPSFEDALRTLEQVVDDLERGEPELSAALAKYEQGVKLVGHCQSALEKAERSVALLTGVDADGNPLTAPFDANATTSPTPAPSPSPKKRPAKNDDDRPIPF
jgi:exodeoxyribonuclease VII small subunit